MGKIIHRNVVTRKPGHLYYVDGQGHVCEAKMARGGKKKKPGEKDRKYWDKDVKINVQDYLNPN